METLQQDVKCQDGALEEALNEANKLCAHVEKCLPRLQVVVLIEQVDLIQESNQPSFPLHKAIVADEVEDNKRREGEIFVATLKSISTFEDAFT